MQTLSVLVLSNSPPFGETQVVDGKVVAKGFDVDICREALKRAGYEPSFKGLPLADLIQSVAHGETDVAFAAMSPTEERKKLGIDFGTPYYMSPRLLFTKTGNRAPATIAAQRGSKFAEAARKYYPQAQLSEFDDPKQVFDAVASGKADALVTLLAQAWDQVKAGTLKVSSERLGLDDDVGASPGYPKGAKPDVQHAINEALAAMLKEGWVNALAKERDLPFTQPDNPGVRASLR